MLCIQYVYKPMFRSGVIYYASSGSCSPREEITFDGYLSNPLIYEQIALFP